MSKNKLAAADWPPTASIDTLRRRAKLLADVRAFFQARNILEVETPILCHHSVTDLHLEPICASGASVGQGFLQTSPEYAMKRLLAAGVGDCFQIFRAFRAEEQGRRHNPEFSLLEWYRLNFDDRELAKEVDAFLQEVANAPPAVFISYQTLFVDHFGLDPLSVTDDTLLETAQQHFGQLPQGLGRDDALQVLFSLGIEPDLGQSHPVIVTDYPASQAALARINRQDPRVAHRFEVYWKGVELANGYWELCDPDEQWQRFTSDNEQRKARGKPERRIDPWFMEALSHGLPECAGVALGLDRLMMCLTDSQTIEDVLAFPWSRA
ncbi:MAG: EF-P lysine aminoacylase GenX [Gammaproteobacteria bacterium]|nr:MAG: EF-P lysine aminoacylase GenX [Gammaproteobacteria bacterium]